MKDDYYDLEPVMIDKETEEIAEEEGFAEEEKDEGDKENYTCLRLACGSQ